MSSIDQQFIEFIVKSIVSKPDAVKVDRRIDEKGVLLELTVDPEDLGRVIGKRGATAQSLRTLLRALGTKNDARYNLKIIDNGAPYERPSRDEYRPRDERQDQGDHSDQVEHAEQPAMEEQAPEAVEAPEDHDADLPAVSDENLPENDHEAEPEVEKEPESESDEPEDEHESVVSKTRKELEDLDDLDV
jgi:predicted RNA-binding protein YlqC (UPF0109 family)